MIKKIVIFAIICTQLFTWAFAWADDKQLANDVDKAANAFMKKHDLPGFAVAVLNKDKILYKNAYGIQNIYTKEPVTTTTMFHMASVTKTFTATALMQLHEQGRIDIDMPMVNYLPYFKLVDDRYKIITVRQVLSHISGMPDFDSNPWHDVAYDEGALERFVRDFVSHKFLVRDPEIKYEYCNTAYEVLGDVIAKVSGMPYEDYVHKNILTPLDMTASSLLIREIDKANLASPHRKNDKGELYVTDVYPYNRMHGPSSTLTSNVEEMSNYLQMYLNGGIYDGNRILTEKSIKDMWSPALGKFDNIGVSWHIEKIEDYKVVSHGGSDVGFKSFVLIIPKLEIAAVFLTNSITPPYRDFAASLVKIMVENNK